MAAPTTFTLVDQQSGNLLLKLFSFEDNSHFDHLQRNNYYSLIWVTGGDGKLKVDFSEYAFKQNSLFAFTPYQPFMFHNVKKFKGIALQFHPDFYCIHLHQRNVACNGILFNNIYAPPFALLDNAGSATLKVVIKQMKAEMQHPASSQHEALVSYLKLVLITATRLKSEQQPGALQPVKELKEPFVLQRLKVAIEKDYRLKHTAGDYAKTLNISIKTLAKITKSYFNKTLTQLISERIIIEAKRELYMTNKTVKEIAYELGYEDEYYFSRFFKANAEVSPQMYRDTVGPGRNIA